jgi:hemoglobin
MGESLYDRIGGDTLRAVVRDFYDRIFADTMIGYMFADRNKERLIAKEWELVAALLGAPVRYTGRPLPEAHARHDILGGHFDRRLQILRDTLADHGVDAEVQQAWIEHTLALRDQVTRARC